VKTRSVRTAAPLQTWRDRPGRTGLRGSERVGRSPEGSPFGPS